MKRRNPRWGCPRIAQQIALAFAVDIDKDVVCDGASRTSERAATPTARWSLRSNKSRAALPAQSSLELHVAEEH